MMSGWSWSPLIYQAFDRCRHVISPKSTFFPWFSNHNEADSLPLLTLHLRRGDYASHCLSLAGWSSTYLGQASFPEFEERDKFTVPIVIEDYPSNNTDSTQPGDTLIVSSQDEKVKYYTKHCYPDIGQVVERVRQVVHDYEALAQDRYSGGLLWDSQKYENWGSKTRQKKLRSTSRWSAGRESVGNKMLKRIYIMTNGDRQLLKELEQALMDDAERSKFSNGDWEFKWTWEGISTSRDLELGWEEARVSQALDMYIAQRSELFIGNGVSLFLYILIGGKTKLKLLLVLVYDFQRRDSPYERRT